MEQQVNHGKFKMAYTASLTNNQQLTIALGGIQTNISLVSSSPGQQQSQSNSFTTGKWKTPPQLYKTRMGFVLKIDSENGTYFIAIQSNSIATINPPDLSNATKVDLQTTPDPTPNDMGFEPMQPMKMGNMTMDINSMSMQMGNMSMNIGKNKTSTKRFCSQCGEPAKASDRFCSSCGHQLN